MTVNELLEKAREDGRKKTYENYLEICDGDLEEAKEWIEHEKANGCYQRDERHNIISSIYTLIRTIEKTTLLNESEKEAVINEIKKCPEWQESKKRVAMIFAEHFVKFQDVYLK